jgi:hypothetical protein
MVTAAICTREREMNMSKDPAKSTLICSLCIFLSLTRKWPFLPYGLFRGFEKKIWAQPDSDR